MFQKLILMSYKLKNEYAYISKQNENHEKNHSFNDSKLQRMALSCSKKLSALLRGISKGNVGGFLEIV